MPAPAAEDGTCFVLAPRARSPTRRAASAPGPCPASTCAATAAMWSPPHPGIAPVAPTPGRPALTRSPRCRSGSPSAPTRPRSPCRPARAALIAWPATRRRPSKASAGGWPQLPRGCARTRPTGLRSHSAPWSVPARSTRRWWSSPWLPRLPLAARGNLPSEHVRRRRRSAPGSPPASNGPAPSARARRIVLVAPPRRRLAGHPGSPSAERSPPEVVSTAPSPAGPPQWAAPLGDARGAVPAGYSVTEVLGLLAAVVAAHTPSQVWVAGEVVSVTRSRAGHLYLTLAEGSARLSCVALGRDAKALFEVLASDRFSKR